MGFRTGGYGRHGSQWVNKVESLRDIRSMVENVKLFGVKVKACDLLSSSVIMLQALPTLLNLAIETTFLFTNPLGNVRFSVVFPFPIY